MDKLKKMLGGSNIPRTIIIGFYLLVLATAMVQKIPFGVILGDTLVRFSMNLILVLAMVPTIQAGIGPNFGVTIGIIGGLIGTILSMEFMFKGIAGFGMAILISIPIAGLFGWLFGKMLNKMKGSEMIVSTYTGFSAVALASILWVFAPLSNNQLTMFMGGGLRNIVALEEYFGRILNDFLSIKVVQETANGVMGATHTFFNTTELQLAEKFGSDYTMAFQLPTGAILFSLAACYLMYLFINSRTGYAIRMTGDNKAFARSSGVNVDKYRLIAVMLSTILGAIGIIVYSQSFGNVQLYQAPLMMSFPAVAAVLIGGASAKRVKISHVIIGTFLFNSLMSIALPVANNLIPNSSLSEIMRMIVQNGVILFALTKVGGEDED